MYFDNLDTDEEEMGEVRGERRGRRGCLGTGLRLLLLFLLPLFLALAMIPPFLSSGAGRVWLMEKINASIAPSTFTCSEWSIGWFSPLRIEGPALNLPEEGMVLESRSWTADSGLWGLLPLGRLNIGCLTLDEPVLKIRPVVAPPSRVSSLFLPVADLKAACKIRNGSVFLSRDTENLPPLGLTRIQADATLPSFWDPIRMELSASIGEGTFSIKGPLPSLRNWNDPQRSREQARMWDIRMNRVELAECRPFVESLFHQPFPLAGRAQGNCALELRRGWLEFGGKGDLEIERFAVGKEKTGKELRLHADFAVDEQEVRFEPLDIDSPWGSLKMRGILSKEGLQGGGGGALQAKASLDLKDFLRDFGPLWGLSSEWIPRTGRLEAQGLMTSDNAEMTLDLDAVARDVAFTVEGRRIALSPDPSLQFSAVLPRGTGKIPVVKRLALQTPFAEIRGGGALDAATLSGKFRLTRLSRDFHGLFPDLLPMAGTLALHLGTQRQGSGIVFGSVLEAEELGIDFSPLKRLRWPRARVTLKGNLPTDRKTGEILPELREGNCRITFPDGNLEGSWKRWSPGDGTGRNFVLKGFRSQGDLPLREAMGVAAPWLPEQSCRDLGGASGRFLVNTTAEVTPKSCRILFNSALQRVALKREEGTWRSPNLRIEGECNFSNEGQRLWTSRAKLSGATTFERGQAVLFSEPKGRAEIALAYRPDEDRLTLSGLSFDGSLGSFSISGSFSGWTRAPVADLAGKWAPDMDAVTRLLFAQGINEFVYAGHGERPVSYSGPLFVNTPQEFAAVRSRGSLALRSVLGLGLAADEADLKWNLAQGRLSFDYQPALNDGRLDLRPTCTLAGGHPLLTLPRNIRVLQEATLTQEMVDYLLAGTNPIFQNSRILGGTLSLEVDHFALSPDSPAEVALDTSFVLVFKNLRLKLGSEIKRVMELLKSRSDELRADELRIPISVKRGIITLDRTVFPITPTLSVTCYGEVDYSGKLSYMLEIPVTEGLFGSFAASLFRGRMIRIPITGTVDHPYFDTNRLTETLGGLFSAPPAPKPRPKPVPAAKSASGEPPAKKRPAKRAPDFLNQLKQELSK